MLRREVRYSLYAWVVVIIARGGHGGVVIG